MGLGVAEHADMPTCAHRCHMPPSHQTHSLIIYTHTYTHTLFYNTPPLTYHTQAKLTEAQAAALLEGSERVVACQVLCSGLIGSSKE